MNKSPWGKINSRYVYESEYMKIRKDDVIQPDGKKGTYEVIERNNFVLIIPKVGELYYLVEQYRYPVGHRSLEFPQGAREENEKPLIAAKRELTEETGLTSDQFTEIGFLYLANGNQTQHYNLYVAQNCKAGKKELEKTEQDMVTKKLTFAELKQKIAEGEIKDSPTVAAFGLLMSKTS